MKRLFCLGLVLAMLLCGCGMDEKANFYYRRVEFQYDAPDAVIAAESRDISGHSDDPEFLLSLYLMGPMDAELVSPFPSGTKLIALEYTEERLTITLSDFTGSLSDSEYTLACACIALTGMDLYGTDAVTILSAEHTITMTRDQLTLFDSGIPVETTEGESP